jgi:hypothetical protein
MECDATDSFRPFKQNLTYSSSIPEKQKIRQVSIKMTINCKVVYEVPPASGTCGTHMTHKFRLGNHLIGFQTHCSYSTGAYHLASIFK